MRARLFILVLAAVAASAAAAVPSGEPASAPASEREALARIYAAAGGAAWTRADGWLSRSSPCAWYGVDCDATARVVALSLAANNLVGTLSPALAALAALTSLHVGGNALHGALPPLPPALVTLNVGDNALSSLASGALPPTLERVVVASNALEDADLARLAALPRLALLSARANAFTSFPRSFASPRLAHVDVGACPRLAAQLNDVAAALAAAPVRVLDLSDTRVAGTLAGAAQLWRLAPTLETLRLAGTLLAGEVPARLAELHLLARLDLSRTRIEGALPDALGTLPLVELRLDATRLASAAASTTTTTALARGVGGKPEGPPREGGEPPRGLLPAFVAPDYARAPTLEAAATLVCPALRAVVASAHAAGPGSDASVVDRDTALGGMRGGAPLSLALDASYHGYALCRCAPGRARNASADAGGLCVPCPHGAVCANGTARARAGFYAAADGSVVACARGATPCLGGEARDGDAQCERGYAGWRCGACAAELGYARWGAACLPCPPASVVVVVGYVSVLAKLALGALAVTSLGGGASGRAVMSAGAPLFRVAITFVQLSALTGLAATAWRNSALYTLLAAEDSLNVAPALLACTGVGRAGALAIAILTPLLALGVAAAGMFVGARVDACRGRAPRTREQRTAALYLVYCVATLGPAARLWGAAGEYGAWLFVLAGAVYTVFVPLLLAVPFALRESGASVLGAAMAAQWRARWGGWEFFVHARTLALVAALALAPDEGVARPATLLAVLVVSAASTAYVRPHVRESTNALEVLSLAALAFAVAANTAGLATASGVADALSWVVFALNIFVVAAFAVVGLVEAQRERAAAARAAFERM